MSSKRFWIVAYPDLKKPVGGIKQLHRVSELISSLGYSCHLIQDDSRFRPSWFSTTASTISKDSFFKDIDLSPAKDVLILPETYVPIISTIVDKDIPRIIFNQNASYTFGLQSKQFYNPCAISSLYKLSSIKQVWCVSRHDCRFISRSFSLPIDKVRRITNAIDVPPLPEIVKKKRQIVYMPRKNSGDSSIVINLFQNSELSSNWSVKPIINLSHDEVITVMQESLLFLSFGFPEGFGLPVAEAFACGCAVIGYDGLGGRELFKYASQYPGLSFPVQYGDWYAFIDSIRIYDQNLSQFQSESLSNLAALSRSIRSIYNTESMKNDIALALQMLN